MDLAGMTLGGLYNLYNRYNGNAKKYSAIEERIRKARGVLLPEKKAFDSKKKATETVADDFANWKGAARKTFDKDMEFHMREMKGRAEKLDNYCDRLNNAAQAANRKSGSYIPLASEVWTAIQNFGDF